MRSRAGRGVRSVALLVTVLLAPPASRAYETDQYSNRLMPIADAAPELDARVNAVLADVAAAWRGPGDEVEFAYRVYHRLGGLYWVDRIERFAMQSKAIERLPQHRHRSIFAGAPVWATRVNFVFGVGETIRLAGSLLGTDKLGHFFSQGFKYFKSHLAGWPEERVLWRGRFNERWLFGQLTTSVYSNADLVANYEGYRFYRSLFEDGVVEGKPAIVRFRDGRATLTRPFAWSDHVNDYWDEALNPSFLSPALAHAVRRALAGVCPDYRRDPEAYVARGEPALRERYAGLGLRDAPENSVPAVCEGDEPRTGGSD